MVGRMGQTCVNEGGVLSPFPVALAAPREVHGIQRRSEQLVNKHLKQGGAARGDMGNTQTTGGRGDPCHPDARGPLCHDPVLPL